MLLKQEIDTRLATYYFYLACALTLLHKTTLSSPAYPPPSIVSLLLTPNFNLISCLDLSIRHFLTT